MEFWFLFSGTLDIEIIKLSDLQEVVKDLGITSLITAISGLEENYVIQVGGSNSESMDTQELPTEGDDHSETEKALKSTEENPDNQEIMDVAMDTNEQQKTSQSVSSIKNVLEFDCTPDELAQAVEKTDISSLYYFEEAAEVARRANKTPSPTPNEDILDKPKKKPTPEKTGSLPINTSLGDTDKNIVNKTTKTKPIKRKEKVAYTKDQKCESKDNLGKNIPSKFHGVLRNNSKAKKVETNALKLTDNSKLEKHEEKKTELQNDSKSNKQDSSVENATNREAFKVIELYDGLAVEVS